MEKLNGVVEFVYVVKYGGFTAAAKALDRSTSYVSRRVASLEDRLGSRLLHRTTRRIQLTEIGAQYYESAVGTLSKLEDVEMNLADQQNLAIGTIRVTSGGKFGEELLADAIADFAVIHPKLSIYLDLTTRVIDLVNEGFDLAIRHTAPGDLSLIVRRLTTRRMMVCGAPQYFKKHGRPETVNDLSAHNCLSPRNGWVFQIGDKRLEPKVRGTWSSNNGRSLTRAAVRGVGLARLADTYVEEAVKSGQLEVVLSDFELPPTTTYLVYPDREFLPYRIRALIDFLVERFK